MWTRFVLPFPARDIAMIPGLLLIFLYSYEIKSGIKNLEWPGDEASVCLHVFQFVCLCNVYMTIM